MNMLIVDDYEENRYLLETMLKGSGHDVQMAANGAEALEKLKAGGVELIISDILMPVMDGFQLCRKVKTDETLCHIPFIIYTATYTGPQDEAFAKMIGADRFIQKPCEPDVFMGAVGDVMAAAGRSDSASTPEPMHEEEILKLYSERLVRKLEKKMLELEREIQVRGEIEETLRESERKYRLLADNTLDIIWAIDLNLAFTYVNPAIQSLMGYSPEEFIGSHLSEHCDEENFGRMTQVITDEMAKGTQGTGVMFEAVLLHKNREPIQFEIHGRVIYDEKGEPMVLQGIAHDITKRKRVEKALKESEKNYRELYDFLPIPVYEMDFEANITSANRAIYETFRGTEADFKKGFKGWQLLSPEDADRSAKNIQRLFNGEKIAGTEYELKRLDGSVFPAIIISSVVYSDGKPLGIRGAIIDIAERRRQEEELRKANAFLDSIVENIPDMIFLKDAKELRFVRLNRAGENLLGYSRDDLLGKSDCDFFPKEQVALFTKNDREVLSRKEVLDIAEEQLRTRSKGDRILHTKKVPILNEKGEPEYLLGISEDITEIKLAEEERNKLTAQLIQAQKLESIGNLAGGIAHDFNNILSVIIGFTEIVLDGVEKGSYVEDCLQEVYKAGERAKDLVNQILTFARQSDEEIKPIQVKPLIKEALNFLRSSIPTTIEIKQKIKSNASIMGNPTKLHQVIMNLCTNAAHAMEENGGTLEVDLTDVRIDRVNTIHGLELKPGDYIKLSISDTGTGIPPEVMKSIFEPYYTTKKPGKGTGLGLSLVHGIVESYHGKIELKSELGKGSVFSVYVPIVKKDESYRSYELPILPSGLERILLIDDEVSIAKMESQILVSLGYKVATRTSSVEALELFRSKPSDFDLVVTDMTMPNMTGDKLAVELMKIRRDIPVILCTGYSKKISGETASEIGIKAFAYKPVVKADLAKTVRKVLDEAKSKNQG